MKEEAEINRTKTGKSQRRRLYIEKCVCVCVQINTHSSNKNSTSRDQKYVKTFICSSRCGSESEIKHIISMST